jgi:hypothetical protein
MSNAWDNAKALAEKHAAAGGIFVRLQNDGDKVVGVFCGEPYAKEVYWDGQKYGCPRGLMEARQRDFVARGPCS